MTFKDYWRKTGGDYKKKVLIPIKPVLRGVLNILRYIWQGIKK